MSKISGVEKENLGHQTNSVIPIATAIWVGLKKYTPAGESWAII